MKWHFKYYAVSAFCGEALPRCPFPQKGHNEMSLPVNFIKSSTAEIFTLGISFTSVFVSFLHSFSFVDLFTGLSKP